MGLPTEENSSTKQTEIHTFSDRIFFVIKDHIYKMFPNDPELRQYFIEYCAFILNDSPPI